MNFMGLKKEFEPDWNPKDSPVGPKKGPKLGKIRNKKLGLYYQIHRLIVYSTSNPIWVELYSTRFKFVFYSYKQFIDFDGGVQMK